MSTPTSDSPDSDSKPETNSDSAGYTSPATNVVGIADRAPREAAGQAASSDTTNAAGSQAATTHAPSDASVASDAADASDSTGAANRTEADAGETGKPSSRKLPVLLFVLLLVSLGANFWQAQQRTSLDAQTAELDLALDRAMERIDSETVRANSAEASLDEIDRSVDNVQERIAELQAALSKLADATAR